MRPFKVGDYVCPKEPWVENSPICLITNCRYWRVDRSIIYEIKPPNGRPLWRQAKDLIKSSKEAYYLAILKLAV